MSLDEKLRQPFFIKVLLLYLLFYNSSVMSETVSTQNLLTEDNMRLITDNVMGGVSQGELKWSRHNETQCLLLTGDVSTENNGGFIQAAMDIDAKQLGKLTMDDGIMLKVRGNGESYNLHLRTSGLWFPWQSYRATFKTDNDWQTITIAFKEFTPYKTSSRLTPEKIKRLGVVAIGRDFKADICLAALGFFQANTNSE